MRKVSQLYSGKAKSLYSTDDERYLIVEYRDDTTAFNGIKKAQLAHKGIVNNHINAFIMQKLESVGIATHFVKLYSETESVVKHLEMIRVESVLRNISAGNLCKRLGVKEGLELIPPIQEFFLKDDALNDPMINDSIIRTFKWASDQEVEIIRAKTLQVNQILKPLFQQAGMLLVDFKLEFGRYKGEILIGDEFTPDGCRVWDMKTREILDKDRFRKDLGNVVEAYEEIAKRLGVKLPQTIHS